MPAVSTVGSGRTIVAAAGTARQLGAAGTTMTPTAGPTGSIRKLLIRAIETNTNAVVIGGAGVVAAAATRQGVALVPTGPPVELEIDDLGDVWVDAITNGEGVSFLYTVA
jgi:hypothetical protein